MITKKSKKKINVKLKNLKNKNSFIQKLFYDNKLK